MTDNPLIATVPSDHHILLAVQRQVAGLVAERDAQKLQIAGLVAERDALREILRSIVRIGYDHEQSDPAGAMLHLAQRTVGGGA